MKTQKVKIVSQDFLGLLFKLTGKRGWKETSGPDSGVGNDYWYVNDRHGLGANINIDQDAVMVSVNDECVFFGFTDNPDISQFFEEK